MKYDNRNQSVNDFLKSYVNELQNKLPKRTGRLSNSVSSYIDGKESFGVEMESYALFLERGVNGTERNVGGYYSFSNKKPPISSIEEYANSIGANPYALQNYIFKNGIRKKETIEPLLDSKLNSFAEDYVNSLWADFKIEVENDSNNNIR
jgi:hypothetical protein